ncbi:secretion protein [Erythrobacter sp. Dej080120_24]|uniref:HlyD family secretion protein n=1 Tax=Erythrobacter sp. Dej080120_24 TaxID=3024837 RepID=UPI00291E4FF3|nr:secretion protein [Erythrobacter sp. Dej080120_24]
MQLFRSEVLDGASDRLHGEVVLSQPLSTRLFVAALFAIIAIAAIWITTGSYARIETVPGRLVTSIPSAAITAPQPGIVARLAVIEGQSVERGDLLLVINSDRETEAGGVIAGRSLGALEIRQQLSEAQIAMAADRAETERLRLAAVISSAQAQTRSLAGQIELQREVVAANQRMYDRAAQVADRGFISEVDHERRRQALLVSRQQLADLEQRQLESEAQAEQARSQLASVGIEAQQGISRIHEGLQALSAEQARLEGEVSYVITAPISGRVTALATGEGRTITSARPVMTIVPEGADLTAELYAPSRAIGLVEPGKEARLLYDAFPYQRFGSFGGKVASISRIAVDPRETDIPFPFEEPVYRIQVALDRQSIEAFGKPAPLQAGMTLQANIVLERQSFLQWMLQPLNAVINRT